MPAESYPYLFEVSSDKRHPLLAGSPRTFGAQGQAEVPVQGCAGDQVLFQVEADGGRWFIRPRDPAVRLTVNHAPVVIRAPLAHRSLIQAGGHVFVFVERQDPEVATSYALHLWLVRQSLDSAEKKRDRLRATVEFTLEGALKDREPEVPFAIPGTIALSARQMLIGRDGERADICLPDVRVSRVHAWIACEGRIATITDLKSTNGTFVDGRRIRQPTVVREGGRIHIGPYNLIFRENALYPLSHDKNVQLVAHHLVRRVPDRQRPGHMKTILDDISLVVQPREFVCILGPSGSGKTTLLSALSARHPADEGRVLLNGENLYAHFEALKQNLAVVPQRDVLHDALPLHVALWYTAKMRLPTDMSGEDIVERIEEMLATVNLRHQRATQIRRLSGGEVKRASWANEAICNPSLIFLDEVTSGLDEATDCEMMQLFRRMADDGKTIVCVTHSLSYVEQNCHLVAILAPGGVLTFYGPPAEALKYFGIARLGDVYQRLGERPPQEWKQLYLQSEYYREYVERRLPASVAESEPTLPAKGLQVREILDTWRQFVLLTRRYLAIQWAHKRALAVMLGQSLFIGILLVWLFGDLARLDVAEDARQLAETAAPGILWGELLPETQAEFLAQAEKMKRADRSSKLLFLLCISCLWFGCNNAAKEIVKERTIYLKERDVGLKVLSYYGSKLLLLGALSILQASLLYLLVRRLTHLSGAPGEQWLLLSLSSLAGAAMGLAISAIARSEDVAVTIVPIALIPQIILAGLIAPLLNYTRGFAQLFISSYWAYQGLLRGLPQPLAKLLREGEVLSLDRFWSLGSITCVLALHIAFFAALALVALRASDRGEAHRWRVLLGRRNGQARSRPGGARPAAAGAR